MTETELARDALMTIPADLSREDWVRTLMAARAAGLSEEDAQDWSAQGGSFNVRDFHSTWRSIKPEGGIGLGTLFATAKQHGWRGAPRNGAAGTPERPLAGRNPPAQGIAPSDVFARFLPAPAQHPYIVAKQGVPDGLRVVPEADPLRIAGESMAGALAVPVMHEDEIQTIQLIAPPETAARLKASGKPAKLNLPGHAVKGWYTVGEIEPGATIYVCEGIGQAWACWKATGSPSVVCFGWGRVRGVARQLQEQDTDAALVLVPDVGKERDAEDIALEVGAKWVRMPAGWRQNDDVNDFAQRDGYDALEALLLAPLQHAQPVRPQVLDFAMLGRTRAPRRRWFIEGWLGGPTLVAGSGGAGKSSLVQHLVTMGALGRPYIASQDAAFKSLVWNCEDDRDEIWRRQERICDHENIEMASLADRLHIVSRYGCENALMVETQGSLSPTALMKELREQVNDLHIDVLWLDNAAHVFLGNHDDRTHVTAFINSLNGLVTGRPFAAVVVAHPGKALGSEYSGSVAWENAVRMRWFLGDRLPDQVPEPGDEIGDRAGVRFLCKRKTNYSATDFIRFTMDKGLLVPDHQPQDGSSGLVAALDEKRAEEVCIAGFRSLKAMGLHPSDSKASPDYLPRQMLDKRLASGYSKSDLAKAMNRLMTTGLFTRGQVSMYSNRNPRMGLVLAEVAP
jgi:putative DNA primase/helicase